MKRLFTLITVIIASISGIRAQCVDTLNMSVYDTIAAYTTAGGYISGTNAQHDKAKAEKFFVPAGTVVQFADVYFAAANSSLPADLNSYVHCYLMDATGAGGTPGNIISQDSITIGNIINNYYSYPVNFPNAPILTTSNFFISVTMPASSNDTLAIYTNSEYDTAGEGWTQLANNLWQPYSSLYASGHKMGNWIDAQVCIPYSAPVAYFGANNQTSCQNFYLIDSSLNLPTSYLWLFPGGTPASSTQNYGSVYYDTAGYYDVTLIVHNIYGSDTLTRPHFLHYINPPLFNFSNYTGASDSLTNNGGATLYISNAYTPFSITWSSPYNGNYVQDTAFINTTDTSFAVYNMYAGVSSVIYSYNNQCTVDNSFVINNNSIPQLSCGDQGVFINSSDTALLYTLNQFGTGTGCIAGNNSAGTSMVAQLFNTAQGPSVSGIDLVFGKVVIAPADSNLGMTVNIWRADGPNGAPGTLAGSTSIPLLYPFSEPTPFYANYTFGTPLIPGDSAFYLGIVLPANNGDTIALLTDGINGYTDGGWVFQNNRWYSLDELYAAPGGAMEVGIGATICGAAPVAHFTKQIIQGCHGSCAVQLTDSSTGASFSFGWVTPGSSSDSGTGAGQKNPVVIYNTSGKYYITEIVENSFGNSFYTDSVIINADTLIPQLLCMVTTDSSDTANTIIWEKADRASAAAYYIYGCNYYDSTTYNLLGIVPGDSLSEFSDNSDIALYAGIGHLVTPHRYKIAEQDTCGSVGTISPYIQTLFLYPTDTDQLLIIPYQVENMPISIASYQLWRDNYSNGNWQVLQNIADTQTIITVPDCYNYPNALYVLVLTINTTCTPGRSATSAIRSNYAGNVPNYTTSIASNGKAMQFTLAPNPALNYTLVTVADNSIGSQLTMVDLTGRQIKQQTITGNTTTLNTMGLASGIYLIQITDHSGNRGVKKLAVQ